MAALDECLASRSRTSSSTGTSGATASEATTCVTVVAIRQSLLSAGGELPAAMAQALDDLWRRGGDLFVRREPLALDLAKGRRDAPQQPVGYALEGSPLGRRRRVDTGGKLRLQPFGRSPGTGMQGRSPRLRAVPAGSNSARKAASSPEALQPMARSRGTSWTAQLLRAAMPMTACAS